MEHSVLQDMQMFEVHSENDKHPT